LGELWAGAGRYRDAERAYRAAAKDPAVGALAIYRRGRVLIRLGDPGASEALSGFAQTFPTDTAAPTALYLLGDQLSDRGDWPGAARWFAGFACSAGGGARARASRYARARRARFGSGGRGEARAGASAGRARGPAGVERRARRPRVGTRRSPSRVAGDAPRAQRRARATRDL